MTNKTNYSYIGIAFIILVFGIIFIPRIIDRVSSNDITRDDNRSGDVTIQQIKAPNKKNQSGTSSIVVIAALLFLCLQHYDPHP